MMNRGEVAESIPFDVVIEILSRLPAESVARFRLVSKLWCSSTLHRPYFTELFLTRQRARPRLFFAISRKYELSLYSSPQSPKASYSGFHIKFPAHVYDQHFVTLTSGLIYFTRTNLSRDENEYDKGAVVCNPNTGRYAILPKLLTYDRYSYGFLGFDPIDKQFKVLVFTVNDHHYILTLETGQLSWRMIHYPFIFRPYFSKCKGICINGVLYYSVYHYDDVLYHLYGIVCFDVRSETFKFVATECAYDELINFNGKLGGICLENSKAAGGIELSLWVLKDAEKEEWLNYIYTLWDEDLVVNFKEHHISIVGMTATGEIVLSMKYTSKPFYVFYYNPEKKTLQKVEIHGLGYHDKFGTVSAFVDHVEDLDIIDAKQLKSNQGLKIIKKRPKPQKPPTSVKSSTIKLINKYELLDNLE